MATYIEVQKLVDLLKKADPKHEMFAALTASGLTIGMNPVKPSFQIDFSKDNLVPISDDTLNGAGTTAPSHYVVQQSPEWDDNKMKVARRNGDYWFVLFNKRHEVQSQKELLKESLLALEDLHPGMLEKLSRIKSRARRIVARDPKDLFDNQGLLEQRKFEKLESGWWLGTNNSGDQVKVWLKRACECANVIWDKDFKFGGYRFGVTSGAVGHEPAGKGR